MLTKFALFFNTFYYIADFERFLKDNNLKKKLILQTICKYQKLLSHNYVTEAAAYRPKSLLYSRQKAGAQPPSLKKKRTRVRWTRPTAESLIT